MDIYNVFLGDSYGSLRHPVTFRDYEKHPYGTWEQNVTKGSYYQQQNKNSVQSRDHQSGHGKSSSSSKDKCPFCKEQKKRPLVSYMRKRENKKHNESICEEEEEEEEEQHQEVQQQQKKEQQVASSLTPKANLLKRR